jgi:uncharacterized protein YbjT (DUF2867 family)
MEVLVTGATGNVGREVVRLLRERAVPVRVTARPGSQREANGVETVPFDFANRHTFAAAARGCGAVFLLRPPAVADTRKTLNPFIDAARRQGVEHVVFLSVAGAQKNPLVPHRAVEKHLLASGLLWTILRPGFFAQNLGEHYRRDIARDDRLFVPAGRGKASFVDVRDVAEVAAAALLAPGEHAGKAYTLTGAEAVSFDEAARILSQALHRPIRYVPASVAAYVAHLRRAGAGAAQIAVQTLLHVGLRLGQAEAVDPMLGELLGRAPRTLGDYVRDHVHLWAR